MARSSPGTPGQRHDAAAVDLQPDSRRAAHRVHEWLGAAGQIGHLAPRLVHLRGRDVTRAEELLVLLGHEPLGLSVELERPFCAKGDPTQGEVVLGRAQTAHGEDELRAARQRRPQLVRYGLDFVAHQHAAAHLSAERRDAAAEPVGVRVEDVAEQHLVAGGHDLDHGRSLSPLGGRVHRRNTPRSIPERMTTATTPATTSSSQSSLRMNERTTSAASAARTMKSQRRTLRALFSPE